MRINKVVFAEDDFFEESVLIITGNIPTSCQLASGVSFGRNVLVGEGIHIDVSSSINVAELD